GFKSTALLVVGSSTITVRPLTRLTLEEIQNITGGESARLLLQTGRIRAEVKPPAGATADFTVRSPIATASVRGTSFDFDGVNLSVDEGLVHVAGGNGSAVYVGAGHRVVSDPVTGRTAGGVETARGELAPDLPQAAAESGFAVAPARKTAEPAATRIDVAIRLAE
ncbi:MAG: FecR family protein, partial [Treponema sp.]|nr:FecR family protein [Treponema sp.]